MTRAIRELVEAEVIYFISPLIDALFQEEKYREQYYHLINSTDWDEAEKAIKQNICIVQQEDKLWGVYDKDAEYYTVEPRHDNKIEAIKEYFNYVNWDLCVYTCEVCEYWLVREWLASKLEDKGETVEKDFMGLIVWGRTTTGQAIWCDYVIQEIYSDLQYK